MIRGKRARWRYTVITKPIYIMEKVDLRKHHNIVKERRPRHYFFIETHSIPCQTYNMSYATKKYFVFVGYNNPLHQVGKECWLRMLFVILWCSIFHFQVEKNGPQILDRSDLNQGSGNFIVCQVVAD